MVGAATGPGPAAGGRLSRRTRARLSIAAAVAVAALGAAHCVRDAGEAHAPAQPPAARPVPGRFERELDVRVFRRGNLHTHSKRSDGDSPPEAVYAWYRDHGYDFVALTDHDTLIDPAAYRHLERPDFILLSGVEITMRVGRVPVHVNGLCVRRNIDGGEHPDVRSALRWAVAEVVSQGGVALVNHPNFAWALKAEDLRAARGASLLEIWSGHPYVYPAGDATRPSAEAIWDRALAAGEELAGVAVDDTHHLDPAAPEPAARPGRAFIEVFANELSQAAVCDALRAGRLYASTGAELSRFTVTRDAMTVWPKAAATVDFIGRGGRVLATVETQGGSPASYRLRGGEGWVRARITQADGKRAWTQPHRAKRRTSAARQK